MDIAAIAQLHLSAFGWAHSAACVVALSAGVPVILRAKGTPTHKWWGKIYVLALLVASLTAFGIYSRGAFLAAHWFGVAAIAVTILGVAAARFKMPQIGWMRLHLTCMLASFYILVGGGVNEVFLRVNYLHRLSPNLNAPIVGETHLAVIVFFCVLVAYFHAAAPRRLRSASRMAAE